jgi:hypothetical protein
MRRTEGGGEENVIAGDGRTEVACLIKGVQSATARETTSNEVS